MELDELHGGEEQEGAAHQHGGADGSPLATAPAAELGQCVHHLDGVVVGGLAELIDRRGRHLHQKESLCDALRVLLMPTFQTESDFLKVEQPLNQEATFLLPGR
jgi:hypothetical protein